MKRSRFSEEQIVAVLKEHELGAKAGDLARKHGISEATLYNWKAKYGGLTVSEAKRLKALEDDNTKLKKLLADASLRGSIAFIGCIARRVWPCASGRAAGKLWERALPFLWKRSRMHAGHSTSSMTSWRTGGASASSISSMT